MNEKRLKYLYYAATYLLCVIAGFSISGILADWQLALFCAAAFIGIIFSYTAALPLRKEINRAASVVSLIGCTIVFFKISAQQSPLPELMRLFLLLIAVACFKTEYGKGFNLLHFECVFLTVFSTMLPIPVPFWRQALLQAGMFFLVLFLLQITRSISARKHLDSAVVVPGLNILRRVMFSFTAIAAIFFISILVFRLIPKRSLALNFERAGASLVAFRIIPDYELKLLTSAQQGIKKNQEGNKINYIQDIFLGKDKELKEKEREPFSWGQPKIERDSDRNKELRYLNQIKTKSGDGQGKSPLQASGMGEKDTAASIFEAKDLKVKVSEGVAGKEKLELEIERSKKLLKIWESMGAKNSFYSGKAEEIRKKLLSSQKDLESLKKQTKESTGKGQMSDAEDKSAEKGGGKEKDGYSVFPGKKANEEEKGRSEKDFKISGLGKCEGMEEEGLSKGQDSGPSPESKDERKNYDGRLAGGSLKDDAGGSSDSSGDIDFEKGNEGLIAENEKKSQTRETAAGERMDAGERLQSEGAAGTETKGESKNLQAESAWVEEREFPGKTNGGIKNDFGRFGNDIKKDASDESSNKNKNLTQDDSYDEKKESKAANEQDSADKDKKQNDVRADSNSGEIDDNSTVSNRKNTPRDAQSQGKRGEGEKGAKNASGSDSPESEGGNEEVNAGSKNSAGNLEKKNVGAKGGSRTVSVGQQGITAGQKKTNRNGEGASGKKGPSGKGKKKEAKKKTNWYGNLKLSSFLKLKPEVRMGHPARPFVTQTKQEVVPREEANYSSQNEKKANTDKDAAKITQPIKTEKGDSLKRVMEKKERQKQKVKEGRAEKKSMVSSARDDKEAGEPDGDERQPLQPEPKETVELKKLAKKFLFYVLGIIAIMFFGAAVSCILYLLFSKIARDLYLYYLIKTNPRKGICLLYYNCRYAFSKLKVKVFGYMTPLELLRDASGSYQWSESDLKSLTEIFMKVRYGGKNLIETELEKSILSYNRLKSKIFQNKRHYEGLLLKLTMYTVLTKKGKCPS